MLFGKVHLVVLIVFHDVREPFFTAPHDSRAILAMGLLSDNFDVHVRHQSYQNGFGSRCRTFCHDGINLVDTDVGIRSIEIIHLVIVFLREDGTEIGVQIDIVFLVIGHVIVVPHLGFEHTLVLHLGFGSQHRGKHFFGEHIATAIVTKVENQLGNTFFLEFLACFVQAQAGFESEASVCQIANLFASTIEYFS